MKYVDLSALPLVWNQIGTLPPIMTSSSTQSTPFACTINGYFSIFFPCSQGGNPEISSGAVIFSFDGMGNMCTYRTSDYSPNGPQTALCRPFQIWQNGNTLIYALLSGGTWKFTVPNVFTPGATYVLNPEPFSTPSPCGIGDYSHTIFCGSQGFYANEFIQAFPESDNYWASVYDEFGNFIGGGYIGNSANDIFDQRSSNLPPYVSTNEIYDRNGLVVYGNFGKVSGNYQVVGTGNNWLNGDATALFCGGANSSNPVFVSEKNPTQIYYARDYNFPAFLTESDSVIQGVTDIPGAILFPDSDGPKILSSDFYVHLPNKVNHWPTAYYSKTKQLFAAGMWFDWSQSYPVYVASLDLTPYGLTPSVSQSVHNGLANYHRAVSPRGLFQA